MYIVQFTKHDTSHLLMKICVASDVTRHAILIWNIGSHVSVSALEHGPWHILQRHGLSLCTAPKCVVADWKHMLVNQWWEARCRHQEGENTLWTSTKLMEPSRELASSRLCIYCDLNRTAAVKPAVHSFTEQCSARHGILKNEVKHCGLCWQGWQLMPFSNCCHEYGGSPLTWTIVILW